MPTFPPPGTLEEGAIHCLSSGTQCPRPPCLPHCCHGGCSQKEQAFCHKWALNVSHFSTRLPGLSKASSQRHERRGAIWPKGDMKPTVTTKQGGKPPTFPEVTLRYAQASNNNPSAPMVLICGSLSTVNQGSHVGLLRMPCENRPLCELLELPLFRISLSSLGLQKGRMSAEPAFRVWGAQSENSS